MAADLHDEYQQYLARFDAAIEGTVEVGAFAKYKGKLVKKMAPHASRSHERLVASLTQSQLGTYIGVLRRLVDANNELGRAPLHLK